MFDSLDNQTTSHYNIFTLKKASNQWFCPMGKSFGEDERENWHVNGGEKYSNDISGPDLWGIQKE